MDYAEALKKASEKTPENYLLFRLDYEKNLLVPHKAGMTILAALEHAEMVKEPYGKAPIIGAFPRDVFSTHVMTRSEYLRIKVAALLNVKPEEVDALAVA